MIPILIVGAAIATIFVAYKALTPGSAQATGVPTNQIPVIGSQYPQNPAPSGLVSGPGVGLVATGAGLTAASTGLSMYSQQQQQGDGGGGGGGAVTAAVAGIGIVGAIAGALFAAHEQRLKQATDENSAVNLGVAGFDRDIASVGGAVNAKQITIVQALPLLATIKANYWALVAPHIQPGRNGCQSGAACPGGQVGGKGCTTGQCKCGGSIGGACCVGCCNINGSIANIIALYQSGRSGSAEICHVFGSKYGATDRPTYQFTYTA